MIDLGGSKKFTAVSKLFNFFFLNAWSCLELSFLEIIFKFLQFWIHKTQDKLVSKYGFDCHFYFYRLNKRLITFNENFFQHFVFNIYNVFSIMSFLNICIVLYKDTLFQYIHLVRKKEIEIKIYRIENRKWVKERNKIIDIERKIKVKEKLKREREWEWKRMREREKEREWEWKRVRERESVRERKREEGKLAS